MALKGFIELLRLERIAETRNSSTEHTNEPQWQGVAFEVAGERFVAPIGEVAEVIAMPETLTPVPLSKPWLLGIANVRGQLLTLADLAKFLNLNSRVTQLVNRKVLVIIKEGVNVGLLVDTVWHIKKFSSSQYVPKSLPKTSPFLPYNHGQFLENDQKWPIFMLSLLSEDPRFLDASL